jgi:hypothetical protein
MARRVGRAFDFEQNEHGNSGLLAADNGTRIFREEVDLKIRSASTCTWVCRTLKNADRIRQ